MVDHGLAFEGTIKAELGDSGKLTPGHSTQAAVHKDGEEEAFPVGFSAHASTQGLLDGALLGIRQQRQRWGEEKDREKEREICVSDTVLHNAHSILENFISLALKYLEARLSP